MTVPTLKSKVRLNSLQNDNAAATKEPITEYGLSRIKPSEKKDGRAKKKTNLEFNTTYKAIKLF